MMNTSEYAMQKQSSSDISMHLDPNDLVIVEVSGSVIIERDRAYGKLASTKESPVAIRVCVEDIEVGVIAAHRSQESLDELVFNLPLGSTLRRYLARKAALSFQVGDNALPIIKNEQVIWKENIRGSLEELQMLISQGWILSAQGELHPNELIEVDRLFEKVKLASKQRQWVEVVELGRKALELLAVTKVTNHKQEWMSNKIWDNLSNSLGRKPEFQKLVVNGLLQQKLWQDAIEALEAMIEPELVTAEHYIVLADIRHQQGYWWQEIPALKEAVRLAPLDKAYKTRLDGLLRAYPQPFENIQNIQTMRLDGLETLLYETDLSLLLPYRNALSTMRQLYKDLRLTWKNKIGFNQRGLSVVRGQMTILVIGEGSSWSTWDDDRLVQLAVEENPGAEVLFVLDNDNPKVKMHKNFSYDSIKVMDCSPAELLPVVNRVYTRSSLFGLDALLYGVQVVTTGQPFYAGWGLSDDRTLPTRPRRNLSLDELFGIIFLLYTGYHAAGDNQSENRWDFGFVVKAIQAVLIREQKLIKLTQPETLTSQSEAAIASDWWPRILSGSSKSKSKIQIDRVAQALLRCNPLEHLRSGRSRCLLAYVLVGQLKSSTVYSDILDMVEATIGQENYSRLVQDLVKIYPSIEHQKRWLLVSQPEQDDKIAKVSQLGWDQLRVNGLQSAGSLLTWAQSYYKDRDLPVAKRLLEMYFVAGALSEKSLELAAQLLQLEFDLMGATDIFDFAYHYNPLFKSGEFLIRYGEACSKEGNLSKAVIPLLVASQKNDERLQRVTNFLQMYTQPYAKLPIIDAVRKIYLDKTAKPLRQIRYLLEQGEIDEAEAQLKTVKAPDKVSEEYHILLTLKDILQDKRDTPKKYLIKQLAKATSLKLYEHALRVSLYIGDIKWSQSLLKEIKLKGYKAPLELEQKTLFSAGQITKALLANQRSPQYRLVKTYIKDKLCSDLETLTSENHKQIVVILPTKMHEAILSSVFIPAVAELCQAHKLQFVCSAELQKLFQRTFPELEFIAGASLKIDAVTGNNTNILPTSELQDIFSAASWEVVQQADRVAFVSVLAADLQSTISLNKLPLLQPNPEKVLKWRNLYQGNTKPLVGFVGSDDPSSITLNPDFCSTKKLQTVFSMQQLAFVPLKFDFANHAAFGVDKAVAQDGEDGFSVHRVEDFEDLIALISCLDLVLGVNSPQLVVAAALGRPTWLLNPSMVNPYWGRVTTMNTDYCFPALTYIDGHFKGDLRGVLDKVRGGLEDLLVKRHEAVIIEAELLLQKEEPKDEALFLVYRKEIRDYESRLDRLLFRDIRYWTVRARLLEKLAFWPQAAECWQQVASLMSANEEVLYQLWRAQIQAYQFDEAERTGKIIALNTTSEHLGEIEADYQRRIKIRDSFTAAEQAINMLSQGRKHAARVLLHKSLDYDNFDKAYQARVCDLFERLVNVVVDAPISRKLVPKRSAWHVPSLDNYQRVQAIHKNTVHSFDKPKAVFCAGFLYSGSGAVVDYLRQFSTVQLVSAPSSDSHVLSAELSVFRRYYGVSHLFDTPYAQLSATQVAEFILGPVLGLHLYPEEKHRMELLRERSLANLFAAHNRFDELIGFCHDLLSDLNYHDPDEFKRAILRGVKTFVNQVISSQAETGKVTLWNNCAQAYYGRVFSLFDDVKIICVTRDPRDQYVSQFYEWEKGHSAVLSKFIKRTRVFRALYEQTEVLPGVKEKILEIRFEDFVHSQEVRERVMEFCGLEPGDREHSRYFDPAVSGKNVAAYKNFPYQDDIQVIEGEFPNLLAAE